MKLSREGTEGGEGPIIPGILFPAFVSVATFARPLLSMVDSTQPSLHRHLISGQYSASMKLSHEGSEGNEGIL